MPLQAKTVEEIVDDVTAKAGYAVLMGYVRFGDLENYRDWLRAALKSYALHLVSVLPEKDMKSYDNMICSACKSFVEERFSHNNEGGFSKCCGKKTIRSTGEEDAYSSRNDTINDCRSALLKAAGIE